MIKQESISKINSRSEIHLEALPLMSAPMNGVTELKHLPYYKKYNIIPVLSRSSKYNTDIKDVFFSCSIKDSYNYASVYKKICVDVANGNLESLHDAIYKIKKTNPDTKIMTGNVSSVEAFKELQKTGVDYIRVGIGGGSSCTTTIHTGVGQKNLLKLVKKCYAEQSTAYIVADGISTFIKQNNYHHNGYAAINNLLYYGADYVMIGSIFANTTTISGKYLNQLNTIEGMSTQNNQKTYSEILKASEGKESTELVKCSLEEWVNGSKDNPNEYPGFVNALRSAMSYTNSKTLKEFKWK